MLLGVFQKGKNVIYSIFFIINKISLINIFNILVKLDKDDRLFTPGPTKYNVEIKAQNPKWTINGAKRRSHIKKPKTPGCGRYEYKSYIGEGPKYSFASVFGNHKKEKGKKLKKFEVPGPGFYEVKDSDNGPKYSMYSRNHDSKKSFFNNQINISEVPGVGKYTLRKDSSFNIPCFKFDKGERNDLTINYSSLDYPGFNKYSADFNINCSTSPSWSFGHEARFPYMKNKNKKKVLNIDVVPGPGAYQTKNYMGTEGPFYTFSKLEENHIVIDKDELKKLRQFPSVGKYINNIRYLSDQPFYSFPKLNKKKDTNDKEGISSPGPGNYNPNKEISSTLPKGPIWSWSASKINRDEDAKIKDSKKIHIITPGPGYYDNKIGKIPQGPEYSMRPILKKIKIVDFPGPGQYNIPKGKSGSPEYSISKGKRDEEYKRIEKEETPGPGSYKIKDVDIAKCFTISKNNKTLKRKDSIPGPGAYKIPSSFDYISNMTRERGSFDPRFRYI